MEVNIKSQLFASRATEKASEALYKLAASEGDLKTRLNKAWEPLGMLAGRELPGPFKVSFEHIYGIVTTSRRLDRTNRIANGIEEMSDADALQHASDIVAFCVDVAVASQ